VEPAYQGVFGGRIDMNLSARGQEQAHALARYLQRHAFEAVYTSPMKRVQQTLAPVLANGGPEPRIVADLREVDFGDWTGLSWGEVEQRYGMSAFAWLDELEAARVPNAESAQTLGARLEPHLRQILASHAGQQVAVFCHGGVIRMLMAMLMRWPLSKMASFQIEYASITRLGLLPHHTELQLVNFTPWRDSHL
ncbi:MAG TPA: histidine phosphatase family protein, partial [Clostridia bacterium]|nr:histidine phosphatase family protein [Clostridia bacterium]